MPIPIPVGYILAAIAGALLAGMTNIVLEIYKRANDRKGVCSAMAGEISAIVSGVEACRIPDDLAELAKDLRSEYPPEPPWVYLDASLSGTPILDAYIERIGILGGRLPERAARFYAPFENMRLKTKSLADGLYKGDPVAAAAEIDSYLALWAIISNEGEALVSDLRSLSGK